MGLGRISTVDGDARLGDVVRVGGLAGVRFG